MAGFFYIQAVGTFGAAGTIEQWEQWEHLSIRTFEH